MSQKIGNFVLVKHVEQTVQEALISVPDIHRYNGIIYHIWYNIMVHGIISFLTPGLKFIENC